MHELFEAQLVTIYEAARKAAYDEIQTQFAEAGLGPEAQDAVADKEHKEGELSRASIEDMDKGGTPP